jgi:hypothetical protein
MPDLSFVLSNLYSDFHSPSSYHLRIPSWSNLYTAAESVALGTSVLSSRDPSGN